MPHVARVHGEARACLDASSSAGVGRPAAEELDSFLTALGNGFLFGLGDPVAQELGVLDMAQVLEAWRPAKVQVDDGG